MPLENPWKCHLWDSKFQNVPSCLGPQEPVLWCEFQSHLLFIISLLLKNFLTALFSVKYCLILFLFYTQAFWPSNWMGDCKRDFSFWRQCPVEWGELASFCQCDGSFSCCTYFEWSMCISFLASFWRYSNMYVWLEERRSLGRIVIDAHIWK